MKVFRSPVVAAADRDTEFYSNLMSDVSAITLNSIAIFCMTPFTQSLNPSYMPPHFGTSSRFIHITQTWNSKPVTALKDR